jgi:hypothetical protein
VNPATEHLYGYSSEDMVDRDMTIFFLQIAVTKRPTFWTESHVASGSSISILSACARTAG